MEQQAKFSGLHCNSSVACVDIVEDADVSMLCVDTYCC